MKYLSHSLQIILLALALGSSYVGAQSSSVDNPTPITASVIRGTIKARDVGDPRSTVHYYVFEGNQGDIFLKVEATNLNGDIDVFYADNMRPLTKISLYADSVPTQTGREIYLRKPERMILRVEGRTPIDDPATYSIRFDGSFIAMARGKAAEQPKLPEIDSENESGIRVNSVGTIIETKPKPTPKPRETAARTSAQPEMETTTVPEPISTIKPRTSNSRPPARNRNTKKEPAAKIVVNESDKGDEPENEKPETEKIEDTTPSTPKSKTTRTSTRPAKNQPVRKETPVKTPKADSAAELAKAMENIRLVVEFKDGAKIERPMSEVMRFGVDKGVLTIVNKNGTIGRYSILDVVRMTIE
jgi:hypothetical protein